MIEKVKEALSDLMCTDPDTIRPDSRLIEDLNCDSLDVVELVMWFEEDLDVSIPDAEAEACRTVADVVALLEKFKSSQQ